MASPPLSEEERRLLREYRLTSIPSRRSSNASTITITSATKLTPKLITSGGSSTSSNGSSNINSLNKPNQLSLDNQNQNGCHIVNTTTTANSTNNATSHHNHHHQNNNNNNNHNHHHHHHHHHHSSNHKRHKNAGPTHELTPEELSKMLKLVSDLSYLKLVTSLTNGNSNGTGVEKEGSDGTQTNSGNCINSTTSITNDASSCRSFIFEKVDYIKKISLRRKAFRRFKKARNKSRVISPANTTESPKIKL